MTKIKDVSSQQLKRIKAELRIGIAKIESGGSKDPYSALPPYKKYPKGHAKAGKLMEPKQRVSSAVGKYQFLKQWWSKNDFNIKSFIDKSEGLFGDTTNLSEKEGMELFRKNPELQDAYFDHYSEKVLIPQALQMMDKNPLNLSVAEMSGQFHFQAPSVAKQGISSGKLTPQTDTNVSGYKYIDIQRKAVAEAGMEPTTSMDIINAKKEEAITNGTEANLSPQEKGLVKSNEEIVENFKKQEQAIIDLGLENPEPLRKKLYNKVVAQGGRDAVNEFIEDRNKQNSVQNAQDIVDYNEMHDLIQKVEIGYLTPNKKKGRDKREFKDTVFFNSFTNSDVKQREKLRKKYPEMFLTKKSGDGYDNHINLPAMKKIFEGMHKNLTGEEIEITADTRKDNDNQVGAINKQGYKNALDIGQGDNRVGQIQFSKIGKITDSKFKPQPTISEELFPEKSILDYEPEPEAEVKKEDKKPEVVVEEKEEEENIKGDSKVGLADEWFNNELALGEVGSQDFNYEAGKKEVPVDAIMGMALGLIGNNQAQKAKIPLRTEEVSEAFKNYAAELSNKSREGIPVEIEAAMRNQLAEAYQGGLANIVNASAGNRATVLGNLGSLEASKTKGLVAIQVADYEAKDRAFAQYGQALQYMDQFDAQRDIANHGIKYSEAKTRQQEGKQLATAGFGKMIEALKYDRENGPGSVNDQYRSLLMQKMFGFDPKQPDNGKGDTRGTKSFYDKNKAFAQTDLESTKELHKQYGGLNPNQKGAMNQFIGQNQNKESMGAFMDYLQQNPDQDPSKLKMDNLDLALKDNDFGLLSKNRNNIIAGTTEPISQLKPEGISGQQGFTLPEIPTMETPAWATPPVNNEEIEANKMAGLQNVASFDDYYKNQ